MNRRSRIFLGSLCFLSASLSADAFTLIANSGKPARWSNGTTSYRFNTATSGYFVGGVDASGTSSDEFQPIRNAFNSWLSVPGLSLSVTENTASSQSASSSDHINTIQWVKTGWRSLSFQPTSRALAVTLLSFDSGSGVITDADIYFNADNFRWAVVDSGTETSYIDVQNIATHEIGHFLGIDHSSENINEDDPALSDATMFFASTGGETSRRTLHADDELAIRALYGNASRGTASISNAELISNVSTMLTYRIDGSGFNEYTSFALSKNSSSELDVVARYRTINSSSEAVVEFDAIGMTGGNAQIIAFNSPGQVSRLNIELDSKILGATSAGGGGGCSIGVDEHLHSSFFWFFLLLAVAIFSLRKNFAPVRKKSPRKH